MVPSNSGELNLLALGVHVGCSVAAQGFPWPCQCACTLLDFQKNREQDSATAAGGVQGQLAEGEDLAPTSRMKFLDMKLWCIMHTDSLGTSWTLRSYVIVLAPTALLSSWSGSFILQIIWERDRGGWFGPTHEPPLPHNLVEGRSSLFG